MNLGDFSISLAVKDLEASRAFYEKLGFEAVVHNQPEVSPHAYGERWLILKHAGSTIGLFQGLFDKNVLTFNPTDVRSIQRTLKQRGVELVQQADDLIDQHNP